MSRLFDIKASLDREGCEYDDSASEAVLQDIFLKQSNALQRRELDNLSCDLVDFLPSFGEGPFVKSAKEEKHPDFQRRLQTKFAEVLKDLKGKDFQNDARSLDVFVVGKIYGQRYEKAYNFEVAQGFYEGAIAVATNPNGTKVLPKVYGRRNMVPVIQQYLALLSRKQRNFAKSEGLYLSVLETPDIPLVFANASLHQLADLYSAMGDVVKQRNTHKRWRKLLVSRSVPEASFLQAYYFSSKAELARMEGSIPVAIENDKRALLALEAAYGTDSWLLVEKLSDLGATYVMAQKFDAACKSFERGYDIACNRREPTPQELTPKHPVIDYLMHPQLALVKQEHLKAGMLAGMGDAKYEQDRPFEAITLFKRAFAMKFDKGDADMWVHMHNYGQALRALGRNADACTALEEASRMQDQIMGRAHAQALMSKLGLGDGLYHMGRVEDAKAKLDEAYAIALTSLGRNHPVFLRIKETLQQVDAALGTQRSGSQSRTPFPGASVDRPIGPPSAVTVTPQGGSQWLRLYDSDGVAKCGSCKASEPGKGVFKVCSRCKRIKYCSGDCQKADWRTHKKDCKSLPV